MQVLDLKEEEAWERVALWIERDLCTMRTTGTGKLRDVEASSRTGLWVNILDERVKVSHRSRQLCTEV